MTELDRAKIELTSAGRRMLVTLQSAACPFGDDKGQSPAGAMIEHLAVANYLQARRMVALGNEPALDHPVAIYEDGEIPHLFERGGDGIGLAVPTGSWRDRETMIAGYRKSIETLTSAISGTSDEMRRKGAAHPIFGQFDGVQWVLFATAHNERHRSEFIALTTAN